MEARSRFAWLLAGLLAVMVPEEGFAAVDDAWITAKTKMALLTTDGAPATDVNVDTIDGRVTLHGKVSTEQEKAKVGEIAKRIDGVREVRNLLQVVPNRTRDAVEAKDEDVQKRVVQALADSPQLEGSDIEVQSVNQGVVLLAGTADSFSDHLSAVSAAKRVPGVRRVATEVKSPDRLADETVATDVTGAAGDAARSAGATANDAWITAATKLRLLADGDAPALDINVDTEGGVVTLFGMVASDAESRAAEQNAKQVTGVKQVKNELQVVASARQDVVAAADGEVAESVEAALDERDALDEVSVEVKNGVVRLSGAVPSQIDRVTAAVVARSTPGVRSVLADDLRVEARS